MSVKHHTTETKRVTHRVTLDAEDLRRYAASVIGTAVPATTPVHFREVDHVDDAIGDGFLEMVWTEEVQA